MSDQPRNLREISERFVSTLLKDHNRDPHRSLKRLAELAGKAGVIYVAGDVFEKLECLGVDAAGSARVVKDRRLPSGTLLAIDENDHWAMQRWSDRA